MKITAIEVLELRVPGWTGAGFDGSWDDCVVRVTTDAGLVGLGEVDSPASMVRAVIEAPDSHRHARGLRNLLLGRRVETLEGLWEEMYQATSYLGRRGLAIHALGALDMALWDLKAQAAGLSLSRALGQRRQERLPAYGTIYPLGETPDEARRAIDRGLALGLKAIKICAEPSWSRDPALAERLVRAARDHVGPGVTLMLDAAGAWQRPADGLPLMPLLAACGFAWIEAPLPLDDVAGHALFQGFGVPVGGGDLGATTRFDFEQLFRQGQIDIAQPDIGMAGGPTEALRILALARRLGRRVVPHGYKSNILLACNLAFLAQQEKPEFLEFSTSLSPLRWELTAERLEIEADGCVAVPDRPGLGVTLDAQALQRFRVA
jgi:L-alanine-DL-glutamate epimerase-like enolase superfamily enzyme